MRYAIITIALLAASLMPSATPTKPKHYTAPDAAFFFANNDDYYEAFSGVAVAMCIQDRAVDDSPEAWRQAAAKCRDSKTDEQGDSISQDGMWRQFVWQAIDVITVMCKANSAKLCENFK